ncbi:MAG: phage major capsid protein [Patescibacteria group bacterium]
MALITRSETFDNVYTATQPLFLDDLRDNFFVGNPVLRRFYDNDAIINTEGGMDIRPAIEYGRLGSTRAIARGEVIEPTPAQFMTRSRCEWAEYATPILVDNLEVNNNKGPQQMINLLTKTLEAMRKDMRFVINQDLFGDGSAWTGKALDGLQIQVEGTGAWSTLQGIDSAVETWWKNGYAVCGSFETNGASKMAKAVASASHNSADKPNIIVTTLDIYGYYEEYLRAHLITSNTKSSDAGIETVTFKGIPLEYDDSCAAGMMYFLNTNALKFYVHSEYNFTMLNRTPDGFFQPPNQDVRSACIMLLCNFVELERRRQYVLAGITA